MRSLLLLSLAFQAVSATTFKPKNFIFIVPDGMAPSSETLVRAYQALLESGSPQNPIIPALSIDSLPLGNVRTHSSNNLVTDSAAAGTAFATGFKTENGAIGVLPDGQPVGTILEAAKLKGYLTGLVVTSIINHATPASYSSHVINRNAYPQIAEQQIGYSHPLNQSVDLLLGGGRCYFNPQSTNSSSCRTDDIDLFNFASSKGYYIAQNRSEFDLLNKGQGPIDIPYIGLFNDNDLNYEIDRAQQPAETREPSLLEMTETALHSLDRAVDGSEKGYFMLIEASRIDHASHAHDLPAHLHDVLEFNRVMEYVTQWIDSHPDTAMLAVADHETGGLTLPGYDPRPLKDATHSAEFLADQLENYTGDDKRGFLTSTILPAYGLASVPDSSIDALLSASPDDVAQILTDLISDATEIEWSTGGHSGVDTILYGYASGEAGVQLKADMAGSHDNTELVRYIEKALDVSLDEVTELLRAEGTGWIPA